MTVVVNDRAGWSIVETIARPLVVTGGTVVTELGPRVTDVVVVDGTIAAIGPIGDDAIEGDDVEVVDARGALVAPGLIDVQCNGAFGFDLRTAPESLWDVAARLPSTGVTAWLPTIVSSAATVVERAVAALTERPRDFAGAEPLGLHLEGPALSAIRRGAHPVEALQPITDELTAPWTREHGVRLVTLAPELPGALDAIRSLRDRGVVIAAGHTDATTAEMLAAVDAGITATTHIYNGMAPFAHREPGPVGVALADERLTVGLIADGVHVHPVAVAATFNATGPARLCLVTDAVAPMGLPDAGDAVRLADGTLAGSTLALDDAIANLVAFSGCAPIDAVACATSVPARLLGLAHRGTLAVGCRGDIVVLDATLDAITTIVAGRVLHRR